MSQQAHRFLEQLQRATYTKLELQPTVYDEAWIRSIETSDSDATFHMIFGELPEDERRVKWAGWQSVARHAEPGFFANMRQIIAEAPTRYEHPGYYSILRNVRLEIGAATEALAKNGRLRKFQGLPPEIHIGTLPTGEVNARVMCVPGTKDYLVLFDSQLFNFANFLSKPIASAMPIRGKGHERALSAQPSDVLATILDHPEIIDRYVELFTIYLVTGSPSAVAPYAVDGEQASMAQLLVHSFELFAMAHEYGHIISGHLGRRTQSPFALADGTRAEEIERSWREEFEADARGVELCSTALQMRGFPLPMSFLGPTFFFLCAFYVERGLSILRTGKDLDPETPGVEKRLTHPPAGMRLAYMYSQLEQSLPPDYYRPIEEGRDLIFGVADLLWRAAAQELKQLHDRGTRPSRCWLELARAHGAAP